MTRVALVEANGLLREGLALALGDEPALEVVAVVATPGDLDAAEVDAEVVVLDCDGDPDTWTAAAVRWHSERPGLRVVGLHRGLPTGTIRRAQNAGIGPLVDRTSPPHAVIEAVTGSRTRTLRRWTAPTIGPLPLTERERTVLELVAQGHTSRRVASLLGVSPRTVENHKQRIFARLGVQNQAQAVAIAIRHGLLRTEEPAR